MNTTIKSILVCSLLSVSLSAELIKTYFEHGELKAETNYVDGTNTKLKEGVKEGIEKVYYEMGVMAYKVNYKNNKRDGKLIWFDKKGNKLSDMFYKNGKLEGLEQSYYPNGKLKHSVLYVNDMKEGKQTEYFDDATVASEVTYVHNKKHGLQKEYTLTGKLYTEVLYENNYKEGTQKWYDADGHVVNSIFYKMDRPINVMKKVQEKKEEHNVLIESIDFSPQKLK